ncbi:Ws0399_0 protein [Plakobranchus ocellatus]|uniref:Ws0399_0 protein n=1 Tax=Plakobranchus ocellatus TaxID=259542 RepID=A0AAV4BRP7_9GAST|nr:Ws0399_0 protein [Plakobranchus ocellatus]
MEGNIDHHNLGHSSIWTVGSNQIFKPLQCQLEPPEHLPPLSNHFHTGSDEKPTHLPPALPHAFFSQRHYHSGSSTYTHISQSQHQKHYVSSLQACPDRLSLDVGGSSQSHFSTWSKLNTGPQVNSQIPEPKETFNSQVNFEVPLSKEKFSPQLISQVPTSKQTFTSQVTSQILQPKQILSQGGYGQKLMEKIGDRTKFEHPQATMSAPLEQIGNSGDDRVKVPLPVKIRGFGALNQYRVKKPTSNEQSRKELPHQHQTCDNSMSQINCSFQRYQVEPSSQNCQNPPDREKRQSNKTILAKKRAKDETGWARNIRKKARSKGESYTSVQGKTVPARSVKPVDCSKCKFNCPSRVSEEERWKLFRHFWNLELFRNKVDYICDLIFEFAPIRPVSGKRSFSRRYTLKVKGKDERVCKDFFTSTFDISERTVVTYMAKKRRGPEAVTDLRGKQTPCNKTPDIVVRKVREHILSQTGLQGDWAFASRGEETRSVKKLYSHYQTECQTDGTKAASISVYRKVYSDLYKSCSQTKIVEIPPDDPIKQLSQPTACTEGVKSEGEGSLLSQQCEPSGCAQISSPPCSLLCPGQAAEKLSVDSNLIPTCLRNGFNHFADFHQELGNRAINPQSYPDIRNDCNQISHDHQSQKIPHYESHKKYPDFVWQDKHGSKFPSYCGPHFSDVAANFNGHKSSNVACCISEHSEQNPASQSALASMISSSSLSSSSSSTLMCSSTWFNQEELISAPQNTEQDTCFATTCSSSSLAEENSKRKDSNDSHNKQAEEKCLKSPSKRSRNEEAWRKNIRKRLRSKGEAYTSVRGKQVEAKVIKNIDCSKCKFKCTSKISEEQRKALNSQYWNLDTYKEKTNFLSKYVEICTPRRKMTGRRALSRKYIFVIDNTAVRVCKDFFKGTLHISESTIATALEKIRNNPDVIVDMRGRHEPGNKTPGKSLQDITDLVTYLTGLRPHRPDSKVLKPEFSDVNHLYKIYKYDCGKKGRKPVSLGIFRGVLAKSFNLKRTSPKKKSDLGKNKMFEDGRTKACSSCSPMMGSPNCKTEAGHPPATLPQFLSSTGDVES